MSITPSDTQTPEFYGYEKCPICDEYTKTVGGHWHECRIEGCTNRAWESGYCMRHEDAVEFIAMGRLFDR